MILSTVPGSTRSFSPATVEAWRATSALAATARGISADAVSTPFMLRLTIATALANFAGFATGDHVHGLTLDLRCFLQGPYRVVGGKRPLPNGAT